MKIIALTGAPGVGKDLFAQLAAEQAGYEKLSFAEQLYREVSEAFEIPIANLQDRATKESPHPALRWSTCRDPEFRAVLAQYARTTNATPSEEERQFSPREILKLWGTEYRRREDPAYWITPVLGKLHYYRLHRVVGCTISDLRFLDELRALTIFDPLVIRLFRFNQPPRLGWLYKLRKIGAGPNKIIPLRSYHASEWLWMQRAGDIDLYNNGTVESL